MAVFLSIFWFIRTTKITLFYLYLWQLKEYQVKRLVDHFRTEKGKKLILNKVNFLKLFLLFLSLFYSPLLLYPLLILYLLESGKAFLDIFRKRLRKPVLTKKTFFLVLAGALVEIFALFFLFWRIKDVYFFAFLLLGLDILWPIISSLIVLVFQPLTVILRNKIIKKAKKEREIYKKLLVVGITGSYGKTSTKEFLAAILSEKFRVLKTKKNQNSEIGISRCILNELKPEHQVFIVEMGAYGKGGINLLSDIVQPKIGILTGINEQHLALFGSQEKIIKTKYELIENLPKDGLAIFNGNNKYCLELYRKTKFKKKLSNFKKPADIWAEGIKIKKESVAFRIKNKKGESADFKVNVLGGQNVENILLAVCCAKELGMDLEEIAKACRKIKPEQGGAKIFKTEGGMNIINSSYSANPDGVIASLDYLKTWPKKKIIVMPCLIELGEAAKEIHQRIGEKIGQICDLAIITTKENFQDIKKGAGDKALFIENPERIVEKIKTFCQPKDVILLEGRIPKKVIELLKK